MKLTRAKKTAADNGTGNKTKTIHCFIFRKNNTNTANKCQFWMQFVHRFRNEQKKRRRCLNCTGGIAKSLRCEYIALSVRPVYDKRRLIYVRYCAGCFWIEQ